MNFPSSQRCSKILILLIFAGGIWFTVRFILPAVFVWLLPFIAAYCVSCIVRPIAQFLSKRYRVRKKAAHVISYFFILSTVSLFLGYIIMRIITELVNFAREVPSYIERLPDFYSAGDNVRQTLLSFVPTDFAGIISDISVSIEDSLHTALSTISGNILSGAADFAAALPDLGLFAVVFIICSFFFSVDYDRISVAIMLQVPKSCREKTIKAKDFAFSALLKYFRGMVTMSIIVYFLLLTGFMILKINYAYLTALLVAIVDFFPLLGTGVVLIPWAIIRIVTGDLYTGIGLLAVWGSVMLIRQFIEPKIMGKALGLHPLITLIAAYTGYKVYGITGAILFPIITLVISCLNRAGVISIWNYPKAQKNPPENNPDG